MILEINRKQTFHLIEETKIETECGAMYQAQDMEFNRTVAVKMVQIQGDTPKEKQAAYQKAYSEVCAMVSLGEENLSIPSVYTTYYDEKKSEFYIVMDWIKGKTLADHMKVPEIKMIQWMLDLCNILTAMEKKRIYHKDIKPSNIMIDTNGKLCLIDFNISISTPNLLEGTINYKAPEMSQNSKYVGREKVDMFSVGVILYEYYTGNVPKRGSEYAKKRSRGPLEWDKFVSPKEVRKNLHPDMEQFIIKCMKLDPKDRFKSYMDMKSALERALRGVRCAQKKK